MKYKYELINGKEGLFEQNNNPAIHGFKLLRPMLIAFKDTQGRFVFSESVVRITKYEK